MRPLARAIPKDISLRITHAELVEAFAIRVTRKMWKNRQRRYFSLRDAHPGANR
jgi:hypothetical protein